MKCRPIKALALYYDFRELTPIGRQGDEMVRLLAKRLSKSICSTSNRIVAASGRQPAERGCQGPDRSRSWGDLSDGPEGGRSASCLEPDAAGEPAVDADTSAEHRRSRALTESGRPDLALELVRNMRGSDVDRLRAIRSGPQKAGGMPVNNLKPCTARAGRTIFPWTILNAAIFCAPGLPIRWPATSLSLERLQTKYMTKMADSPEALAFEIVTRPFEAQGVEFLEIANQLADVDSLETFLEGIPPPVHVA
jgi:hypothetical protein